MSSSTLYSKLVHCAMRALVCARTNDMPGAIEALDELRETAMIWRRALMEAQRKVAG